MRKGDFKVENYLKMAERLQKLLPEAVRCHYGYSEVDGIYFVEEFENETYTTELSTDGAIRVYRRGNGKGCFDVLDSAYNGIEDYENGICTE